MRKFFAILFITTLALTACKKEETTGKKVDDVIEAGKEAAAGVEKKVEETTK